MLRVAREVSPFMGIRIIVVQFFRLVGVTNVAPVVRAQADVANIERCHRRAIVGRRGVLQQWDQRLAVQFGGRCQLAHF